LGELKTANPDVYVVTSDSGVTLEELRRGPETRDLRAVQEGRVVVLPAELVTRAGPNVATAFEQVAVALHPDAFR
jgi:ABC-type Fe3+-hydroxamate transport system substrate-binding protein